MASLTSSPRSITALALSPTGVPAATASRSMSPVDSWTMPRVRLEPRGLRALARAGRAQEDDVQHAASPLFADAD